MWTRRRRRVFCWFPKLWETNNSKKRFIPRRLGHPVWYEWYEGCEIQSRSLFAFWKLNIEEIRRITHKRKKNVQFSCLRIRSDDYRNRNRNMEPINQWNHRLEIVSYRISAFCLAPNPVTHSLITKSSETEVLRMIRPTHFWSRHLRLEVTKAVSSALLDPSLWWVVQKTMSIVSGKPCFRN